MKKEINSKSRRKWIRGGLAAFASVALLTTGFAVWVVGSQKTSDKGDVNVTVDTAQNESVVFKFNLDSADSAIELKENGVKTGKMVNTKSVTDGNHPLSISYKASTIKFGANYDFKFKSIKFSIEDPADMKLDDGKTSDPNAGNEYASVKVVGTGRLTGEKYARATGAYTYLEAPKSIAIPTYTKATSGTTTITIPASTLDFSWGSFYGTNGTSPADFYNTKFAAASDDDIADHADEVEGEYDDLRKNFIKSQTGETIEWKKLKLVATLSEEEVTSEEKGK